MTIPFVTGYAEQLYLTAEEGLKQAIQDKADYWYIDGSLPHEYPENWTTARLAALQTQIDKNKVTPIFHGNFKLPLSSDIDDVRETAIKQVYAEIDISSVLEAPLIIHGGAIVEPRLVIKAKKVGIDNYLKSIDKICNYANKKNVAILLENLSNYKHYRPFHYIFTTIEEYSYVFSKINSDNVFFFFDLGHGIIGEGEPISVIAEFSKKIWGMSFSNNDGVRDQHLQLNSGVIDYQTIVKTILKYNWKGVIAFETRGRTLVQSKNDLLDVYIKSTVINSNIEKMEAVSF